MALGSGLGPSSAAALIGRDVATLYSHRRQDPQFARQWADMLELSCEPIDAELWRIADNPEESTRDRLRALELLRRSKTPRPGDTPASIELTQVSADGQRATIRATSGARIPD